MPFYASTKTLALATNFNARTSLPDMAEEHCCFALGELFLALDTDEKKYMSSNMNLLVSFTRTYCERGGGVCDNCNLGEK